MTVRWEDDRPAPWPSVPADPDIIRGIERVTGERYDWITGTWTTEEPP